MALIDVMVVQPIAVNQSILHLVLAIFVTFRMFVIKLRTMRYVHPEMPDAQRLSISRVVSKPINNLVKPQIHIGGARQQQCVLFRCTCEHTSMLCSHTKHLFTHTQGISLSQDKCKNINSPCSNIALLCSCDLLQPKQNGIHAEISKPGLSQPKT